MPGLGPGPSDDDHDDDHLIKAKRVVVKWTFPSESSGIFILSDHHEDGDKDDDADAEKVDEKNDY